jgi:hypothetical protein
VLIWHRPDSYRLSAFGCNLLTLTLRNRYFHRPIDAVNAVVVHHLTLAAEQGMRAAVTEAGSFPSQFLQPFPERCVISTPPLVAHCRAGSSDEPARILFGDGKVHFQMRHRLAPCGWRHHFFLTTP